MGSADSSLRRTGWARARRRCGSRLEETGGGSTAGGAEAKGVHAAGARVIRVGSQTGQRLHRGVGVRGVEGAGQKGGRKAKRGHIGMCTVPATGMA